MHAARNEPCARERWSKRKVTSWPRSCGEKDHRLSFYLRESPVFRLPPHCSGAPELVCRIATIFIFRTHVSRTRRFASLEHPEADEIYSRRINGLGNTIARRKCNGQRYTCLLIRIDLIIDNNVYLQIRIRVRINRSASPASPSAKNNGNNNLSLESLESSW